VSSHYHHFVQSLKTIRPFSSLFYAQGSSKPQRFKASKRQNGSPTPDYGSEPGTSRVKLIVQLWSRSIAKGTPTIIGSFFSDSHSELASTLHQVLVLSWHMCQSETVAFTMHTDASDLMQVSLLPRRSQGDCNSLFRSSARTHSQLSRQRKSNQLSHRRPSTQNARSHVCPPLDPGARSPDHLPPCSLAATRPPKYNHYSPGASSDPNFEGSSR